MVIYKIFLSLCFSFAASIASAESTVGDTILKSYSFSFLGGGGTSFTMNTEGSFYLETWDEPEKPHKIKKLGSENDPAEVERIVSLIAQIELPNTYYNDKCPLQDGEENIHLPLDGISWTAAISDHFEKGSVNLYSLKMDCNWAQLSPSTKVAVQAVIDYFRDARGTLY